IHTELLLAPLTANQPTSATNPEQRSAVANKTTSVTRVVSGTFNSVLRSAPEKANDITITTNATRPDAGQTVWGAPSPGRRLTAAAATNAATATKKPQEKRLVQLGEFIPLRCAELSIRPSISTRSRNFRRDIP